MKKNSNVTFFNSTKIRIEFLCVAGAGSGMKSGVFGSGPGLSPKIG